VRSSNPVLNRLGSAVGQGRAGGQQAPYGQNPFQQPQPGGQYGGYQQPGQGGQYPPQPGGGYQAPPGVGGAAMTLDDVVIRTVMLLAITGISGALAWTMLPEGGSAETLALVGSCVAGLVLGLVIAFMRITNPVVIIAYAVIQGVMLGVVSEFFEKDLQYNGIVMQAVAATFAVFFVMAALYKLRVLRATPKFAKFLIGALLAFVALSLINLVAYAFGFEMGLVDYGTDEVNPIAFLFAGIGIVIGALTFILDFAEIEDGVRQGIPEKYAWYSAFGLLVGLIFLYWQILRMLSYLRR
jgi:uncharacterized YccA/Bax inhibitor family protein